MDKTDLHSSKGSFQSGVPTFEQKLYRTLREIDASLIPEYMESFGLESDRAPLGVQLKEFADKMSEEDFVLAMRDGSLPQVNLSPVEIEVLYHGTHDLPGECPPTGD